MIITHVVVYRMDIPLTEPFRYALGTIDSAANILVRIHTDEGSYGTGEGAPIWTITGETQGTSFEAAQALAKLVIGRNPIAIEARVRELDSFLIHNTAAKCAFDMALYDLAAKTAGMPLYAFLGGEPRTIHTDHTIGIGSPQEMAERSRQLAEAGYTAIKIKLGTNHRDDIARIAAIREAVGKDIALRVDANQGWSPAEARVILQNLRQYTIDYCEEPIAHWNNRALCDLRSNSPIPIMADESLFDHRDAFRLAAMGACDYFNIKLAKSGGIHHALEITSVAESAGITCMVGCMFETRLAITAAAHLMTARPVIRYADLDEPTDFTTDPVEGGIQYERSRIHLPDQPGLGADIRADFLSGLEQVIIR